MTEPIDPFTTAAEFEDDAAYAWWRNTHPDGFILAMRARRPPMLHRAGCREVDRDRHPGRLGAKGSRQLCADTKSVLRAWLKEQEGAEGGLIDRCPKCAP
ncbi:MAG TPA: hypothetical protein VMK65_12320 [Longimicrobiales bacterium]|nr:hypothetical protein [Longimicrobiales bacterium]